MEENLKQKTIWIEKKTFETKKNGKPSINNEIDVIFFIHYFFQTKIRITRNLS